MGGTIIECVPICSSSVTVVVDVPESPSGRWSPRRQPGSCKENIPNVFFHLVSARTRSSQYDLFNLPGLSFESCVFVVMLVIDKTLYLCVCN